MLSIAISLFSLTVPWFMQYFTDNIIIAGKWENVTKLLIVFIVITFLRYIVDMVYEKLLAHVTYERVVGELREQASHILVYLKTKYLYKKEAEVPEKDMESILLGDIDAFRNVLSQTIKFFTEILKLAVYITILFFYSTPVGVLVCYWMKSVYRFLESQGTVILITHRDIDAITREYPNVKIWTLDNNAYSVRV